MFHANTAHVTLRWTALLVAAAVFSAVVGCGSSSEEMATNKNLDASTLVDADAGDGAAPPDGALDGAAPPDGALDVDISGDGKSDVVSQCRPGETRECWPGEVSTRGVGACKDGTQSCTGSAEFGTWGDCEGAVTPTEEQCENGVDDDCNGKIDCQDPACEPCSITFYSNDTWTVPTGVTVVWLTGTGGGGGGGGFGTGSTEGYPGGCMYPQYGCYQGGGGGGGGAAAVEKFEVAVTAGTTYTIVVGQGGTQSAPYQIGVGGSATTFADLLTLPGGGGASNVFNGSPGGPGGPGGQPGEQGGDHGGKGGDTLFGVGGGGSAGGSPGTGYGSGGGGTTWSATGSGGSGAPGFLTIEW